MGTSPTQECAAQKNKAQARRHTANCGVFKTDSAQRGRPGANAMRNIRHLVGDTMGACALLMNEHTVRLCALMIDYREPHRPEQGTFVPSLHDFCNSHVYFTPLAPTCTCAHLTVAPNAQGERCTGAPRAHRAIRTYQFVQGNAHRVTLVLDQARALRRSAAHTRSLCYTGRAGRLPAFLIHVRLPAAPYPVQRIPAHFEAGRIQFPARWAVSLLPSRHCT